MIDTKAKSQTNQLKLIPIDFDQLIKEYLPKFTSFLQNYFNHLEFDLEFEYECYPLKYNKEKMQFKNYRFSIDQNGSEINVSKTFDLKYGVNNNIRILKGNLTIAEWAKKILTHYCNWLKKQYQKQSKMSPAEIAQLLDKTHDKHLFTSESYATWIINQISHLDKNEIAFNELQLCQQDYLISSLLTMLNEIKTIKASVLARLIDCLKYNSRQYNYYILMNKLCGLILELSSEKIKVIFDQPINYNNIINRWYALQLELKSNSVTPVTLPINSVCDFVAQELDYINKDYKITAKHSDLDLSLAIRNEHDLAIFVQKLAYKLDNEGYDYIYYNISILMSFFNINKVKLPNYRQMLNKMLLSHAETNNRNWKLNSIYGILDLLFIN